MARKLLWQIFILLALALILPSTRWVPPLLPPVNRQLPATSLPVLEKRLAKQHSPGISSLVPQTAVDKEDHRIPSSGFEPVSEVEVSEVEEVPLSGTRPVTEKVTEQLPETEPSSKVASLPASPPASPEPAAYLWGLPHQLSFRTEVRLTNSGSETAECLWVDLPLLENSSPYQSNTIQGANYAIESSEGRVASFNLGDLAPGETKTVAVDYLITIRPVSLDFSNDVVERARQAYRQYAGSSSCRAAATGFVERCRELEVTARLVNGFTRPRRVPLAPGPLQGCRHSWAEFYVDGLGWVPVDLTFGYFADLPFASHLVESYDDQSVHFYCLGGRVEALWENVILP